MKKYFYSYIYFSTDILVFFYKAELFMITSGAAIFLAYLKTILKPQKAVTIGQKISEYIERVIYAIAIISSGYVVFANTYSVSSFIWLYQYFALVCILVVLAKIVMTIISRKGDARITAILILIFVSVVAYGAVRDILWNQETISVSFEQFIFPYTLVFFFIGQIHQC